MLSIISLLDVVIARNLENISLISTVLPFPILDILCLVCCWVITLKVIGLNVVMSYDGTSLSPFMCFSTHLLFFSLSFLGNL